MLPPPLLSDYLEIHRAATTDGKEILSDYTYNKKSGELVMTNKKVTESQSGIFGDLIKKFAKAMFTGNRLKVSLPVRMFEPRSTIERIADGMRYVPIFV